MCDFIELQNLGKSPNQNPSRFNTPTVTLSLRTIVTSVVTLIVIFATMLLTAYLIHDSELKQLKVQVSTSEFAHMVNNLQQQYEEQMHQNISHSLVLDKKTLLQLHNSTKAQIMKIYDDTEKLSDQNEAESAVIYRNQLSEKIDNSFAVFSHEQTFKKLASEDWKLSNETKEQIKQLYDEEFQAALASYEGRDPPEVSADFHEHVAELTLSKAVVLKIVPPSQIAFERLQRILWTKYNQKLEDHVVIGIDFGERFISSFLYKSGHPQEISKYETFVGLENYEGYSVADLKYAVATKNEKLPIFYDLKEIIRAWNSFNDSSNNLYWTFNVQKGNRDGPTVSSSSTGLEHSAEEVVAKLFQKVKEAGDVNRCVITIPYDFTVDQEYLILKASKKAGFKEITFLEEDISAAMTLEYAHGPWVASKNIMFLEFDQLAWKIFILEGHQSNFTRVASEVYGKTQDVVQICIKNFCEQVEREEETFKYDGLFEARVRWRRLYEECQNAIFYFTENDYELHFEVSALPTIFIFRNDIEEPIKEQVENFTHFIDSVLRQRHVKLSKEMIDEVIVGGKFGNLSVIKETIGRYFNGRNLTINGVSPVDTIAYGAAVKGLQLAAAAVKRGPVSGSVL